MSFMFRPEFLPWHILLAIYCQLYPRWSLTWKYNVDSGVVGKGLFEGRAGAMTLQDTWLADSLNWTSCVLLGDFLFLFFLIVTFSPVNSITLTISKRKYKECKILKKIILCLQIVFMATSRFPLPTHLPGATSGNNCRRNILRIILRGFLDRSVFSATVGEDRFPCLAWLKKTVGITLGTVSSLHGDGLEMVALLCHSPYPWPKHHPHDTIDKLRILFDGGEKGWDIFLLRC